MVGVRNRKRLPSCSSLQSVEIAQDVAPLGGNPAPVEPIFEFLGEQEREKGAEYMAANGRARPPRSP
jgi:hypothetical protein